MIDTADLTSLEEAIYAAAYVDALRSLFCDQPLSERVRLSQREAAFVVEQFRTAPWAGA